MSIKVAIVDDHVIVVNGLIQMLNSEKEITIINSWNDGKSVLEGLVTQQPDVLLLDIQLPDTTGVDLAGIIVKTYPSIKIMALTGLNMTYYVKTMFQKGVLGYLLKNTDRDTLLEGIRTVNAGEQFVDPALRKQLMEDLLKNKKRTTTNHIPSLSRREKDVLDLIVEAHTSQQIADKLFLSLRTIDHYRANLLQKLDVKNTAAMIKKAFEIGLI